MMRSSHICVSGHVPLRGLHRNLSSAVAAVKPGSSCGRAVILYPNPRPNATWRFLGTRGGHRCISFSSRSQSGGGKLQQGKRDYRFSSVLLATLLLGSGIVYLLATSDERDGSGSVVGSGSQDSVNIDEQQEQDGTSETLTAWDKLCKRFDGLTDAQWSDVSGRIVDYIVPEWSKNIPNYLQQIQRELTMAPGSLAHEIWEEAHNPFINPEIRYSAQVRVSNDLCEEERDFLVKRKEVAAFALAKYLGLDESEVHPDDVPVIALSCSGGGLRALTAAAGAMVCVQDDGLFDCATYTAGVSGSCWLQVLFNSSLGHGDFRAVIEHLKARVGIHMAYPPTAFESILTGPSSKYLLADFVEKLNSDPGAQFGIVDIYGVLLAARLLVPKSEIEVEERDFKLSNQQLAIQSGRNPLPIYTAVRHEIPPLPNAADDSDDFDEDGNTLANDNDVKQSKSPWFQWFEFTPYELFCEEFGAGIPIWAMGREFKDGHDVPDKKGRYLPETRIPSLMGIWGSAFCATLSHYYREIRPLVRGITGFNQLDGLISQRDENLQRVHPIDPASIPNFVYGMGDRLPGTTPASVTDLKYLNLMDAGMSNNLPLYPLMRPGRNVEVVIAFDTSADVRTDNWLSVAEGYARQRGVKGWPVGTGWPSEGSSTNQVQQELEEASAVTKPAQVQEKLQEVKEEQVTGNSVSDSEQIPISAKQPHNIQPSTPQSLGYCSVWVGTKQERTKSVADSGIESHEQHRHQSSTLDATKDEWRLTSPDAGITVIYLPFMANPSKVPGVDPSVNDYLSTWNMVYTPEQIDDVVRLAHANYEESKEQIRATIRAVYNRKRSIREEALYRHKMRRGEAYRLGELDHFS